MQCRAAPCLPPHTHAPTHPPHTHAGIGFTADSPFFQQELAGAEDGIHQLNAYMGDVTKSVKAYIKNMNAGVASAVALAERFKVWDATLDARRSSLMLS